MERRSQAWPWVAGLAGGLAVLALLVAAYSIGYNRGEDKADGRAPAATEQQPRTPPQPAAAGPGRDLFAESCGSCHALEAAGTNGTVGPDLDQLRPDAATVQAAIENGGTGSGAMPANIVRGREAREVADFVAAAAAP
jgi:mono/diheme cytochrome c family protein